jgi:hypothetical protein
MHGMKRVRNRLLLRRGVSPIDRFSRDAVFTLDNLFFANGEGLAVDDTLVEILQRAQNGRSDIDALAIFGRTVDGQPNGKRGTYLTIADPDLVAQMLAWIWRGAARAHRNKPHTPFDEPSGS